VIPAFGKGSITIITMTVLFFALLGFPEAGSSDDPLPTWRAGS
jgi:hypothetical protein